MFKPNIHQEKCILWNTWFPAQRWRRTIHLHLFADCFMKISYQSTGPQIEKRSSWNSLQINEDKLTSVISVQKALHWALYHVRFQNISELDNSCIYFDGLEAIHIRNRAVKITIKDLYISLEHVQGNIEWTKTAFALFYTLYLWSLCFPSLIERATESGDAPAQRVITMQCARVYH